MNLFILDMALTLCYEFFLKISQPISHTHTHTLCMYLTLIQGLDLYILLSRSYYFVNPFFLFIIHIIIPFQFIMPPKRVIGRNTHEIRKSSHFICGSGSDPSINPPANLPPHDDIQWYKSTNCYNAFMTKFVGVIVLGMKHVDLIASKSFSSSTILGFMFKNGIAY